MKTRSVVVVTAVMLGALLGGCGSGSNGGGDTENGTVDGCMSDVHDAVSELDAGDVEDPLTLVPYAFGRGALADACAAAIEAADTAILKIPQVAAGDRTFDNTMLALENALADLWEAALPLTFIAYVGQEADIRDEGFACESDVSQFSLDVFTRLELYEAIKDAVPRNDAETRLAKVMKETFESSGLGLSEEQRNKVRELLGQISDLGLEFSSNLYDDTSTVAFTEAELDGVSEDFIAQLDVDEDGKLVVGVGYVNYVEVMQSATNPETRHKMLLAYQNVAAEANTPLLEQAIEARGQVAELLGFDSWADYRIDGRMAKDGATVKTFLTDLQTALKPRLQADLNKLLAYKKELDTEATKLDPWDITFLAFQLSQRDYVYDPEEVRNYFPGDIVQEGLFGVFGELFNVDFEAVLNANVWAPGVKFYRILDHDTGKLLAYTFTDFVPRDGKYNWFAEFEIRPGRMAGAEYNVPIAGIVGDFPPPADEKPSLLYLEDVETLFHEFGHVMHATLTRAPYSSLSGTAVAMDFVETPSQLMETFPSKKVVLERLSGLYTAPETKLPDALLDKVLAARGFNLGYTYTRQILLGLFDLEAHSADGPVDVTALYDQMYQEILGIEPLAGGHFPAGFDHLMSGYDSGYYGYLWAEVIALDIFSEFEKAGVLDAGTGAKFRRSILEQGDLQDPNVLIEDFLGRPQSNDRFLEKLGIEEE